MVAVVLVDMGAVALMQKVVKVIRDRELVDARQLQTLLAARVHGLQQWRWKSHANPFCSLFAGREAGGGTQAQVYGNSMYGSGYPGVVGRGVVERSFPFYFWPLAWGGVAGAGRGAHLHDLEYDNTSRPGSMMTSAIFPSNTGTMASRLVADTTTVTDLITSACSSSLNKSTTSTSPIAFNDIADTRISYRILPCQQCRFHT
ncbi:hypothetical protein C8J56DRAFT_192135 [Mycena floridula]|nr:hypothetical protein C8J56DRAFT_192135 [Mycena floridula]